MNAKKALQLRRELWEDRIKIVIPGIVDDYIDDIFERDGRIWVSYKFKGEGAVEDAERFAEYLKRRGFNIEVDGDSKEKVFVNVEVNGDEEVIIHEGNVLQ